METVMKAATADVSGNVLNRVIENDLLVKELSLPSSWRGARVELRIIPAENHKSVVDLNNEPNGVVYAGQLAGILNKYANPSKIEHETDGWKKGMDEKYGIS
ncbi:hypothetical protein AGMMS49982_02410 [Bacteroidia bacterium]|nr:hypothetical protein AGMMS49982_02410 [Bacteroidia bacterium]